MPIVYQVRDASKKWVPKKATGKRFQDPASGEVFEVFRLHVFAQAIGRTSDCVRDWFQHNQLPPPVFRVEGDQCKRWFSAHQIINCHRIFMGRWGGRKCVANSGEFQRFLSELAEVWYCKSLVVKEDGTPITSTQESKT